MRRKRRARVGSHKPIRKLRIALVGAGNWSSVLAASLQDAGYAIDLLVTRDRADSRRRSNTLARKLHASTVVFSQAQVHSDVVWFCVPDGAISSAAARLPRSIEWTGKIALHSSGALTSDELGALRRRGAAVASVHPLMTFVQRSAAGHDLPSLEGVPFAVEGDREAVRVARQIVSNLGGSPFIIRKRDKPLYHAWGMFLSPLLTALLAASENVAVAAGIQRSTARKRMLPIVRQTLVNYAAAGPSGSFSGPLARGDVETVEKHLKVLQRVPGATEIYLALAKAALRNLPARNRRQLNQILRR
ncbi:MAG: DUF2520 domain-containing protein [Candidatus Sulfotelmatobacter sp.]|jgi:predicted short-subunit dehydrogenase-like oxidoreductase (DUF2520 family)